MFKPRASAPARRRDAAERPRRSGPITGPQHRRRYVITMSVLVLAALGLTFGIMTWDNPAETGSRP